MTNPGFRIYENFTRPNKELLEAFRGIPVPNIDDCLNRTSSLGGEIKSYNKAILVGTAYTVSAPEGDNLAFYYAIAKAQPGDVIVVANHGFHGRALCGEIMATWAMKRGLAGFIVDGAIRDAAEIAEMDFPVFACCANPNGPYKNGPGEINVPISVGGVVICPGDIIIGSQDGLVVVKPEDAPATLAAARAVMAKEAKMMEQINTKGDLQINWVYEKLNALGCEFIKESK